MFKLQRIHLINYCGFKNFKLNLVDNNITNNMVMLYGPNGIGKSNLLNAVRLLSTPWTINSRSDNLLFFRKLTYHPDYLPNYEGFDKTKTNLYMEAVFQTDDGDKQVIYENNWDINHSGVIKNDLSSNPFFGCFYVDADNPINNQKFQLISDYKEEFLDFAESVYGFKCELPERDGFGIVEEYDSQRDEYIKFYTDFIITKYNNTKVHFKRMSAGEKKIATMLTELFNNIYGREAKILLIDNVELHVYFKRHMKLITKLNEYFSNCQIIATTHSPVIIKNMGKKHLVDMEEYVS